jgi:hypothetical protein
VDVSAYLCLPGPKDPSSCAFIRIKLRLDKLSHVIFVLLRKAGDGTGRFPGTAAYSCTSGEGSIVPRAFAETIQVLCAVSHGASPLSRNSPFVVGSHLFAKTTRGTNMSAHAHANLRVVKDFVVMRIKKQIPHSASPIIPGRYALEGVMEGYCYIGCLEVSPSVHVELLYDTHVETAAHGFVE